VEVRYRESFLRDLKKLKKLPIYEKIYTLSFETLPGAAERREIPGVKAMQGHPHRYRIRVASYRIAIEIAGPNMNQKYTAVVKKSSGWWIGWIEEFPGVNCQEATREAPARHPPGNAPGGPRAQPGGRFEGGR
jgi:mRNA interferase RelE/StbE